MWYLDVDGHSVHVLAVLGLSLGVGLIAGMFAVGGGFLLVPLLDVVLGVPFPAAVGASLCMTIATATGAYLRHRGSGNAETRFDLMLIGGSVLGVDAGARLLAALEDATVSIGGRELSLLRLAVTGLYAVLFAGVAGVLWFKQPPTDEVAHPGPLSRIRWPPLTRLPVAGLPSVSGPLIGMIGFANGVIAGMIGIGGGILLIPIMLYGFGFGIRKTGGTGIVMVLAVAVAGTIHHAAIGNVHLGLTATAMIGAALAAQVGAGLTRSLPARTLRRALAVVMVASVTALIVKLVSTAR
jgi:uncharacterized membrane protein YfcA